MSGTITIRVTVKREKAWNKPSYVFYMKINQHEDRGRRDIILTPTRAPNMYRSDSCLI